MNYKVKILVLGLLVLLTFLFFVFINPIKNENEKLTQLKIENEILNKAWNYSIYLFTDTNTPSNFNKKCKLKRNAIFRPNGLFENEYFSTTNNSYMKTYGNWRLKDSILNISFKKDNEWQYLENNDSVRVVGGIVRFSEDCFMLRTVKPSELDRFNEFLFKSQKIDSLITSK